MANQWFKFYGGEYLSDPKIDRLTVQERSCWLTLLCMASQTNGIIKFLSVEGLLNKSGIQFDPYDSTEWDNAQNVLRNFEQYEMIEVSKSGVVTVKNWEKRQEHNLTVAERVAKSRAKKKSVTSDVTSVTTEENRIEENRIDKELPLWLNKEKWNEWLEYRKQSKKKMTELTIRKQLKFLEIYKKDHVQIIDKSITNGWQGLFAPDSKNYGNSDAGKVLKRRIEDDEAKREREDARRDDEARYSINQAIKKLASEKSVK